MLAYRPVNALPLPIKNGAVTLPVNVPVVAPLSAPFAFTPPLAMIGNDDCHALAPALNVNWAYEPVGPTASPAPVANAGLPALLAAIHCRSSVVALTVLLNVSVPPTVRFPATITLPAFVPSFSGSIVIVSAVVASVFPVSDRLPAPSDIVLAVT